MLAVFHSCTESGCMDNLAENYNPNATDDDGSCIYPPVDTCLDSEFNCLEIDFYHFVDGIEIVYGNDNIFYENYATNNYSVRRVLYVLSDIHLFFEDTPTVLLDELIFINSDDPTTLRHVFDDLPAPCVGISFRLGFSSENNIDNEYIDVENNFHSLMLWPNLNGVNPAFLGGYHYMKIEGKYIDSQDNEQFYNNHTGPTNGTDFSSLYSFEFSQTGSISLNMNINNWYNDPIYDFNIFGSGIMENIEAQDNLYMNSGDVFSITIN